MVKTDELKGVIAKRGLTQSRIAKEIGIVPKTFYGKMKRGVFGSDEISKMVKILDLNERDIVKIFFVN